MNWHDGIDWINSHKKIIALGVVGLIAVIFLIHIALDFYAGIASNSSTQQAVKTKQTGALKVKKTVQDTNKQFLNSADRISQHLLDTTYLKSANLSGSALQSKWDDDSNVVDTLGSWNSIDSGYDNTLGSWSQVIAGNWQSGSEDINLSNYSAQGVTQSGSLVAEYGSSIVLGTMKDNQPVSVGPYQVGLGEFQHTINLTGINYETGQLISWHRYAIGKMVASKEKHFLKKTKISDQLTLGQSSGSKTVKLFFDKNNNLYYEKANGKIYSLTPYYDQPLKNALNNSKDKTFFQHYGIKALIGFANFNENF